MTSKTGWRTLDLLTFLAYTSSAPLSADEINGIVHGCTKLLPSSFQSTEPQICVGGGATAFVSIWKNEASKMPAYVADDGREFRLLSGYVTDFPPTDENALLKSTPWGGVIADFQSSPGGIYSLIAMDKRTGIVSAVQSRSGISPVYYTNTVRAVAISDRAIISHVAANNAVDVQIGFVPSLLQSNFLVDGSTPYNATLRLSVKDAISSHDGAFRLLARNDFAPPFVGKDLDERIDAFVDVLKDSIKPYAWTGRPVLRISGGKDSRLLAALLWSQGIECQVENHNPPNGIEGAVADRVAKLCGMQVERNYPQPADILQNFHDGMVDRGGMLHSVPLHYPYPNSVKNDGVALTLGHAHHLRGGFTKRMREPRGGYIGSIAPKFASPLVRDQFRMNVAFVNDRLKNHKVPHLLHHSYWAYSDLRVPYYLSVHYTEYASHVLPIYPLLDEKTLLFCEGLVMAPNGFFDMVSEMLMFGATVKLNPSLSSVPLANNTWRFEVAGPKDKFSEGYEDRMRKIEVPEDADAAPADPFDPRKLDLEIFSYLRGSQHYEMIRSFLRDDFVQFIDGVGPAPEEVLPNTARESVYAAFGCAALLDGIYRTAV